MNKLRSMTEITSAINKCLKNVANNYIADNDHQNHRLINLYLQALMEF